MRLPHGLRRAAPDLLLSAALTPLLAWPLLWNRFPLVYWDTSEYLWRWAAMRPGYDRPLFYSLFLAAFRAFPFGIYVAALAQAAIAALLLVALLRSVHPGEPGRARVLASVCALLVAGSPSAFHLVTLMPDASALWIGLAAPVVALAPSALVSGGAAALLAASMTFHSSNLPLALAVSLVSLLGARAAGRALARPSALFLAAFLLQPAALAWNASRAGLPARPRPTGATFFLAARLQESGLLAPAFRTLAAREADPARRARLDGWAASLSSQPASVEGLLWSAESPLNRDFPAWRDAPADYRSARALLEPAVAEGLRSGPGEFLAKGARNVGEMALGRELLGGWVPHGPGSGVDRVLSERWGRNHARHRASRQAGSESPSRAFPRFVRLWTLLTPVAVGAGTLASLRAGFLAVRALLGGRTLPAPLAASLPLGLLLAADLLVCGFLSMAASRYLERVVAAGPLALLLAGLATRRPERASSADAPVV